MKCDHEKMIITEIEAELKKNGNVLKYRTKNDTTHYAFNNDEVQTIRGIIKTTVNASKSSAYVEATAETQPVRPFWWWLLMTIAVFSTGGLAGGYLIYHLIKKPNDSQISQRTQQLIDGVLANVANKCEVLV